MIGFLDTEFNSDSDFRRERTDFCLLEIALLISDKIESLKVIDSFQTYCKPYLNRGKVRDRITKLTGITQKEIDAGLSLQKTIDTLFHIIKDNNIECIYTWSTSDKEILEFNKRFLDKGTKNKLNQIIRIIKDAQELFKEKLGLYDKISLQNALLLCNFDKEVKHNSLDDCKDLQKVLNYAYNSTIPNTLIETYNEYAALRSAFYIASRNIKYFNKFRLDSTDILLNIISQKDTYDFSYIYIKNTDILHSLNEKYSEMLSNKHLLKLLLDKENNYFDKLLNTEKFEDFKTVLNKN